MPAATIVRLVGLCIKRPWWTVLLALILGGAAAWYTAQNFAIRTDVRDLLASNLPWSQRSFQYNREFPERGILVVLDAPTAELVEQAADELADALRKHSERFRSVSQPGGGSFFEQNGLLFLATDQVKQAMNGLKRADDLIGTLASDPSLRGSLDALSLALLGVERGEIELGDLIRPMTMAADTVEAGLAGKPTAFSWRALASSKPPSPSDLRRFIQVEPVLDFSALEPGRVATDAIVQIASELKLEERYQTHLRQTGRVPIDDDEFGILKQNAALNAVLSVVAVLFILWLALRSLRVILAVVLCVCVGLAFSTAVGLLLVGALNIISVAFFWLFVGLGVDFAIQYSVRYRAERHDYPDLGVALRSAALKAGGPLALAAVATAVGFASFVPTDYRGLSELGEIAGIGMLIAFLISITLLPALLAVLKPPGEPSPVGFAALAPVDRFLERHRIPVVVGTLAVVVLASPLLLFLPFDFNPLHLQSPKVESAGTFLELRRDPQTGANAANIIAPNLDAANAEAQRLSKLPEVAQVRTLSSFIPSDQDEKIKLIREAAAAIDESLNPKESEPPPTDQDTVETLNATAGSLSMAATDHSGSGAEPAMRLSGLLSQLANAEPSARNRVEAAVVEPLRFDLDQLRHEINPQPISVEAIPPDLAREWIAPNGNARIQVLPKGDPDDTQTVRKFVDALLAVEPNATGPAVMLFEAGNTVLWAFLEAAMFALAAIFILLLITLRRLSDVLLTLVPLLVAGFVTLELCVVFGLSLNFANILALPLLLGVGVAFKIYYIMAWRAGKTDLLQSTLTRAVVFSAMTTATAFGSLWMSPSPGMSSMGELMALALLCTMAAAVLFQPVLMGPPRQVTS
jgi:hopanoid biosynthesis associated RND transporter like protein HpnN